jgi:sugar-specific transcriptional regulator TrmB
LPVHDPYECVLRKTVKKAVKDVFIVQTSIIDRLMAFGLDEREARIYLELLRRGPMTAGRLASELGVTRLQVYRAAKRMVERGLISTQLSKPQRFVANPLQQVIENYMEELRAKVKILEGEGRELLKSLEGLVHERSEEPLYTFRLIEGRRNAYLTMRRACERAKERIDLSMGGDDLALASLEGLDDALLAAADRGVAVRILTEITPFNAESISPLLNSCMVRHVPYQRGRVMIEDGKGCFVSLVLKRDRPDEEMGLWTDGAHFVELMERSFGEAFEHAEDGLKTIRAIEARMGNYRVYRSMIELVRERLTDHGYTVEAPATVRGRSGLNHELSLLIRNPMQPGKSLVADLCISKGAALDATALMEPILKLMDIQEAQRVLVAVPGIDRKALELCRFLGLSVVVGEPTSAADELLRMALSGPVA